ncbi:uncharacterized protein I303_103886 [Kwoniella dejecticola CBS 10117]|uniref:Uncharacterized protein n=1 Tax=Kwoniella dejecticola CBS 10117 TaxID=1296121 RepID=A0A1A6A804_9TREE|nr:uncharacterized protein I303_03905 [Kwoniella dejecticola CBS 10117]OBR86185.1 hypothetical protein I303_03905 [Kwoniella dejecticola CBS 10117]
MGSNISKKSRKGAEIINNDGIYSRFYLVPDHPDSMGKIQTKIQPKFKKWLIDAKQVPPPSPPSSPASPVQTPSPPETNWNAEEGDLAAKKGEYQYRPQGKDGYIQVEFTKRGKWSNARWEPLEQALHHHKLTGLNGRPKRLKDKAKKA